jgi:ComF family protein
MRSKDPSDPAVAGFTSVPEHALPGCASPAGSKPTAAGFASAAGHASPGRSSPGRSSPGRDSPAGSKSAALLAALGRQVRSFLAELGRGPAGWKAIAGAVVAGLGRVLAPDRCASCDEPPEGGAALCGACAATVVRDEVAGSTGARGEVVAYALYAGAIARAVRRFKYGDRPDLAGPLGQLVAGAARGLDGDVVVPVPLHPRKRRARGYNQAALLAEAVARELAAPLAARALVRTRDTPAQAHLDRAGRLSNLEGAFRVRTPASVRGRRVVLVDDVCTTGSTLEACRAALLAAGATSVTALVLARAGEALEPRGDHSCACTTRGEARSAAAQVAVHDSLDARKGNRNGRSRATG